MTGRRKGLEITFSIHYFQKSIRSYFMVVFIVSSGGITASFPGDFRMQYIIELLIGKLSCIESWIAGATPVEFKQL